MDERTENQRRDNHIISFYNKESASYSVKRYQGEIMSHTKSFFHRRLSIINYLVGKIVEGKNNLTLLDIACADGIITQELAKKYNNNFQALIGNDIAPQMIEVAKERNHDSRISFYVKSETPTEKYDIVLGLGFITGSTLESEVDFAKNYLKSDGFYICTLVSKYSIMSLLKVRKEPYYQEYWSYKAQEKFLRQDFKIIKAVPCGIFVPFLWKFPSIAKEVQPILEVLFSFLPNFYQEKMYLLKRKV